MRLILYIIFFFIVFNFPIPGLHSSLLLAILTMSVLYLRKGGRNKDFYRLRELLRTSQFTLVSFLYFGLIVFTVIWAFFHGTNDYSIIKSIVLCYITILAGILFVPFALNHLFDSNNYIIEVCRLIIMMFITQSVIQIIAFTSPVFYEITAYFKKETITQRDFKGIRALALTGNPFFSLSSTYGLSFISFFYLFFQRKIKKPIIIFILLFIGSFFAGRTAFIGLVFGLLIYFFYASNSIKLFFSSFFRIIFYILSIGGFLFFFYLIFVPENTKLLVEEELLPFAFEFYYNYQETGELSTASTDVLSDMYFPISTETFFLGDGKYINSDGSYYKHTDSGYMRNILFYGLLGVLYISVSQILLLLNVFKSRVNYKDKVFLLCVLIYFFVLHYKGEVLMYMPILQTIFIVYSLAYLYQKEEK